MNKPIQDAKAEDLDVLFEVECSALGTKVVMYKQVWYGHILHPKAGHSYMKDKIELVKRAVQNVTRDKFLRISQYPNNDWYADLPCPDFKPHSDFLRVSFRKTVEGVVMITSAYHIGVVRYEPS